MKTRCGVCHRLESLKTEIGAPSRERLKKGKREKRVTHSLAERMSIQAIQSRVDALSLEEEFQGIVGGAKKLESLVRSG